MISVDDISYDSCCQKKRCGSTRESSEEHNKWEKSRKRVLQKELCLFSLKKKKKKDKDLED